MCESVCLFLETSDGVVSNEVNNSNEINNTDGGSIRIARLHSTSLPAVPLDGATHKKTLEKFATLGTRWRARRPISVGSVSVLNQ